MQPDQDYSAQEELREARPRVFGTNLDDPEDGRIFIWTKNGWLERIEGTSGNVAFAPIAENEADLREIVNRDQPGADIFQLGGEYRKTFIEEYLEQESSYRDTPEYSEEEPEDVDEVQEYHQHDVED
jgi:hypothetical protein